MQLKRFYNILLVYVLKFLIIFFCFKFLDSGKTTDLSSTSVWRANPGKENTTNARTTMLSFAYSLLLYKIDGL